MSFCTNLESKDLNVIAYSNKNPVAYKILILIGELIAYLGMLKYLFRESQTTSLRAAEETVLSLWFA